MIIALVLGLSIFTVVGLLIYRAGKKVEKGEQAEDILDSVEHANKIDNADDSDAVVRKRLRKHSRK